MPSLFGFLPSTRDGRRLRPTETIGATGTSIYGGYIVTNEQDSSLTGEARYRTFSNILANVSIVAAGVRYFLNLTARVDWKIDPVDSSDEAKQVSEFIEQLFFEDLDTPWFRVIRRAAMYRFYGFSVQEWTARRREDGMLTFADIAPRAQLTIIRWDVNESGQVVGCIQQSPQDGSEIYLPRERIVYHVDDTLNDSPEGLGLFRHIVESSKRLRRYEQLEGFGYENDLRGIPVGRAPLADLKTAAEQGNPQSNTPLSVLTNFIQKHIKNPELGIILDSRTYRSQDDARSPSSVYEYDLQLLQGSNPALNEVASAIDRVNREIGRILGVEHLLLGDGDRGSEALARSKADNFALIVESTLNEIRETVVKDVVRTAMRLNGLSLDLMPIVTTNSVSFRNVSEITQSLASMAQAGAVLDPDDEAINEVRDLLGLSRIPQVNMDSDASLLEGEIDGDFDAGNE